MAYTPQRLLTALERSSDFFLDYPEIMLELESELKTKSFATLFTEMRDSLRTELTEKDTAISSHKSVKDDIKRLSSSLRTLAHHLEDIINGVLALQAQETKFLHLQPKNSDVESYEDFLRQLQSVMFDFDFGKFVGEKISEFQSELAAYKKARANVGNAELKKNEEVEDVVEFSERMHAQASALLACVREYLRRKNTNLYNKFSGYTPRTTTKTSAANVEEV